MAPTPVDPEQLRQLTELFAEQGADDPEGWARSQLEDGIPQLARYCLLKAMWSIVVPEEDETWLDRCSQHTEDSANEPCAQLNTAIREMLNKGVHRSAIIDLVRVVQFEALSEMASFFDGELDLGLPVESFAIFEVDGDGNPVAPLRPVDSLTESFLSLDPTGREMRPREAGR